MTNLSRTLLLLFLSWAPLACMSTRRPDLPGHGEAFARIALDFET